MQEKQIDVKVVMLGRSTEQSHIGWSYLTGRHRGLIYLTDPDQPIRKMMKLLWNTSIFGMKSKLNGILNVLKMIQNGYCKQIYAFYNFRYAMEIFKLISKYKPYRIHSHFAWGNAYISAYVARLLGVPFSLTVHADDIFGLDEEEEHRLKWLFNECDKIITISKFNNEYLVERGVCTYSKIEVIHCGIPLDKFKFSLHHRRDENHVFRIVTIPSGFVEKKGLSVLIRAVQILLTNKKYIECLIVGDSADKSKRREYEKQVAEAGLLSRIRFLGAVPQSDLTELYKNCHAFVLPSIVDSKGKMDGIPVSLMEAMAVGLPVVSTKLSGIPELIDHENQGLLAMQKDAFSLSEQLRRLMDEPEKTIAMCKAARAKIEAEFDIDITAGKLIEILSFPVQIQKSAG